MAQQLIDRRDQEFVIWEQMTLEETLDSERFKEFNRKACDLVINEARAIAVKEMLPTLAEGDRQGVRFENGAVKVPDCFHRAFELDRGRRMEQPGRVPGNGRAGGPAVRCRGGG